MNDFKKYGFLTALVCIAIFFPYLEVLPVNIMEARNFITAREMLTDGNWLLTTMNGLPRYEKPPLPTWLTAFSGWLFGINNVIALRLPAAFAATALVWVLHKFSARLHHNLRFSFLTALIAATSFYIIVSGRDGQWDIFTHTFMLAGIYFFFRFLENEKELWKNAFLAAVFTGFSFLSKGPVSFYALFLPFLIAYGMVYKFKSLATRLIPLIFFIILALALGFSWYIYVRWADPASFLGIAREETANWTQYNIRPVYYYWSFVVQSGVWTIPALMGLLYPYLSKRVTNKKAYRFSFLWTIFSVVLLSLIPEKKSRYLLPVLIPMALTTAFYIEYLIVRCKELKSKQEIIPVYIHFGLIALIGLAFPFAGYWFFKERMEGLWSYFITASAMLGILGIAIVIQLKKKDIQKAFILNVLVIISFITLGFPLAKTFRPPASSEGVERMKRYVEKNHLKLYSFAEIAPEIIWQCGEPIPPIKRQNKVQTPSQAEFAILVVPNEEKEFQQWAVQNYTVSLQGRVDANYQRTPKNRLMGNFYFIKRKI